VIQMIASGDTNSLKRAGRWKPCSDRYVGKKRQEGKNDQLPWIFQEITFNKEDCIQEAKEYKGDLVT